MRPAEEDVAGRLHEPLPRDDTLPLVAVLAPTAKVLQDGRLRLFGLQEQRFVAVTGIHEHDPGAGANAADSDYLTSDLDQLELLEQDTFGRIPDCGGTDPRRY